VLANIKIPSPKEISSYCKYPSAGARFDERLSEQYVPAAEHHPTEVVTGRKLQGSRYRPSSRVALLPRGDQYMGRGTAEHVRPREERGWGSRKGSPESRARRKVLTVAETCTMLTVPLTCSPASPHPLLTHLHLTRGISTTVRAPISASKSSPSSRLTPVPSPLLWLSLAAYPRATRIFPASPGRAKL